MTREEREMTIQCLTEIQEEYIEGEGYERHPLPEYFALDMAIKELEQQPCEDYLTKIAKYERIKKLVDEAEALIIANRGVVCVEGYYDIFVKIKEAVKND